MMNAIRRLEAMPPAKQWDALRWAALPSRTYFSSELRQLCEQL